MFCMNMDELWLDVGRKARKAYASSPKSYARLSHEYEAGDWRQVVYWMQNQRWRHKEDFTSDFLDELSEARSALAAYDHRGMRSVLDGLNALEKRAIGECLRAVAYGPFFRYKDLGSFLDEVFWIQILRSSLA